ncbi:MAG: DUF1573 domain-containing protein [Bacteroidota bacterium]|nr:DUF1573 domain-containing protein [Bacteroidota bacterium]
MKKIIFTFISAFALTSISFAQTEIAPAVVTPAKNPEFVQFQEIVHDFGNIKQGVPVSNIFTFKNVGNRDITLDNVSASCGCTTPNWKGGIYKPGESGEINATFNAASGGFFQKSITVTTSEGTITLTIKGTVMAEAEYNEWKTKKDAEDAKLKAEQEAFAKTKEGKKAAKKAKKEKKVKTPKK